MRLIALTAGLLLLGAVDLSYARPGDNKTPKYYYAHAFECYNFQSNDNGWPAFLVTLQQQGYTVVRYKNDTFDDNPEGCTISNLVGAANSGVLGLLYVHGNGSEAAVQVYKTARPRDDAFDAYVAAGWNPDPANPEITKDDWQSGKPPNPVYNFYTISLMDDGFSTRLKPKTDSWDTAVILSGVCHSQGLLDDCGGRVRFGNSDCPRKWDDNLRELLEHMSGWWGGGDKRPAGEAYAAGSYEQCFKMAGNGKTTLCPVVRSHSPKGILDCQSGVVAGKVLFDTESCDRVSATDIIKVSPNATLNSASWTTPKFEISFEIGGVEHGETITVTVDAEELISDANSTALDGNQNPAGSDGTRPNEDDFVWTFTCAQKLPALSQWGIVVVCLLLLTGITARFGRRRATRDTP